MYVDALHDRDKDEILVVERVDGQRVFRRYPANYTLYFTDPKGNHESIFGDRLSRFSTPSHKAFMREKMLVQKTRQIFESDINPVFRCLEENYLNVETPVLNIGFFDIEVAFDTKRGFAPIDDPFNNITAISIYLSHLNKL